MQVLIVNLPLKAPREDEEPVLTNMLKNAINTGTIIRKDYRAIRTNLSYTNDGKKRRCRSYVQFRRGNFRGVTML